MSLRKGQAIYAQGDAADALFVIQKGKVKVGVRSQAGREAILDILSDGDFVGKDSVAGQSSRTASASAMTDCSLLRIEAFQQEPVKNRPTMTRLGVIREALNACSRNSCWSLCTIQETWP